MCTGGETSSASEMGDSMPNSDNHLDTTGSLNDLTPQPNSFMHKFLANKDGEPLPLLAEYFGVALAFAALGALIRGNKLTSDMKFSPKLQRLGLQVMLKSAMDRLQALAVNAQDLDKRVKESKDVSARNREAWEAERRILLQKLTVAETQISRAERSRMEDAKANEKVVGIFASYEQGWKNEKKKLKREIEILRSEIVGLRKRSYLRDSECEGCDVCKEKEKTILDLEDKLSEKEFLMIATMEEAQSEQHERSQLVGKLAVMEMIVSELRGKLSIETAKNVELLEVVADVKKKQEETEMKLAHVGKDLETASKEVETLSVVKKNQKVMIEELLDDLVKFQKDVDEKEEIFVVMLKRASMDREEKHEIAKEVAHSKSKRKAAEGEKERWKRLADERPRVVPSGKDSHKSRRGLESGVELEKLSELLRTHNEEVQNLRSIYVAKLKSLEGQLKSYEETVALLGAKIQAHNSLGSKRMTKEENRKIEVMKVKEIMNHHELVTLLESIEPDAEGVQPAGAVPEIQEVPMRNHVLKEWLKEWLDAVKARHASSLEQRHWHEIDSFERQMHVKDERMESFCWQLLSTESKFSKMKTELEMLKSRLAIALDEKCRAEQAADGEDKELQALMQTVKLSLHPEHFTRKRLRKLEDEHHTNLLKVSEDADAELQQKDNQLAVVQARLCQLGIQGDNERQISQKATLDMGCDEVVPDDSFTTIVARTQETDQKNAISIASTEVKELADKIALVRKQMKESVDYHQNGLEDIINLAMIASSSEKELSILNAESLNLEINNTFFFNHKTMTALLEDVSHAVEGLPSKHQEESLEPEPHGIPPTTTHVDRPSTSGGYEKEGLEEMVLIETDVVFNSKEEQEEDITFSADTEIEVKELAVEQPVANTGTTDTKVQVSRKRVRRKSLKEYFLDSPPELAVENAYSSPTVVQASHNESIKPSVQGALQVLEKNVLPEITPKQDGVALEAANPLQPLFARMKSKRRESSKTTEDLQVLGLALELRKIEEQLGQIDERCRNEADITVNPATGLPLLKVPPLKKHCKQYAALTGKAGQLAKQMGLTSNRSPEIITDNSHFNRKPSTSELLNLHQRAEAVSQRLTLFQTKATENPFRESTLQETGISKDQLVDIVKDHLTEVQRSLSWRMALFVGNQEDVQSTTGSVKVWLLVYVLPPRRESAVMFKSLAFGNLPTGACGFAKWKHLSERRVGLNLALLHQVLPQGYFQRDLRKAEAACTKREPKHPRTKGYTYARLRFQEFYHVATRPQDGDQTKDLSQLNGSTTF